MSSSENSIWRRVSKCFVTTRGVCCFVVNAYVAEKKEETELLSVRVSRRYGLTCALPRACLLCVCVGGRGLFLLPTHPNLAQRNEVIRKHSHLFCVHYFSPHGSETTPEWAAVQGPSWSRLCPLPLGVLGVKHEIESQWGFWACLSLRRVW